MKRVDQTNKLKSEELENAFNKAKNCLLKDIPE